MQKIYVLNGYPKSGKTEFGLLVGRELSQVGINFLHTSSIDPVKTILQPTRNWGSEFSINVPTLDDLLRLKARVTDGDWSGNEADKTPEWRKKMSDLKQLIYDYDPEFIHEIVLNTITESLRDPFVAFVDIREPENIKGFLNYVNKVNPEIKTEIIIIENGMSIRADNQSDMSVEQTDYDIRIVNPRHVFRDDVYAYSYLRALAKTFVENEVMNAHSKERIY